MSTAKEAYKATMVSVKDRVEEGLEECCETCMYAINGIDDDELDDGTIRWVFDCTNRESPKFEYSVDGAERCEEWRKHEI